MKKTIQETTFAITDVETTGGVSNGRMTEVCIILLKDGIIQDSYTSLINPECPIPRTITALTGINNEMVAKAPKFRDIARTIDEFTRDAIFVAHNVNFDFGFFKKEFAKVGINYNRKKLCTVRLSRKLIPGLPSYSLGRLTAAVGISLKGAHRAEADTRATTTLFQKLLQIDNVSNFEVILNSLNVKSKEGTLPPHLPAAHIFALPEAPGIYLFKNAAQKVIYVGKAKNIKSRVLSHLYSKVSKEIALAQETHQIDFEETGNELTALLLEASYIQQYYPAYNKAQKRPVNTFQIINYKNRKGIIQLAVGKTKSVQDALATLYNNAAAIEKLEQVCEEFMLCPKFCSLQKQVTFCSHYKLKNCQGVCQDQEPIDNYNERVQKAILALENEKESYVIKGKGRTMTEFSVILVEDGVYKGFGFIEASESIGRFEEFSNFITPYKSTFHTTKIIQGYMKKEKGRNVIIDNRSLSVRM